MAFPERPGRVVYPFAESIDIKDFPKWINDLAEKVNPKASWKPVLERFRITLVRQTKKSFDENKSPDGIPWVPRMTTPARPDGSLKILQDKGLMITGVTTEQGNEDTINEITDNTLKWGTRNKKAYSHQEGETIYPRGKAFAIPWSMEAYNAGSPREFGAPLVLIWPRGRSAGWLVEKDSSPLSSGISTIHYMVVRKATIPKREFLGITDESIERLLELIVDHLRIKVGKRYVTSGMWRLF